MSNVKASQHQIGINAVAAQNFTLTAEMGDGTLQLQRGVPGEYLQLLAEWDANGFGSVLTPPQFDDTQKIATAEFVQRAIGNYRDIVAVSSSTLLDSSYAGKFIGITASGITLTLPPIASVPSGTSFIFKCTTATAFSTIAASAGDSIVVSAGLAPTSINLDVGETAEITRFGSVWILDGSTLIRRLPSFSASLSSAGWQKFPSGLIIQWNIIPAAGHNVNTTWTYPIPFPSSCKLVLCNTNVNDTNGYASATSVPGVASVQVQSSHGATSGIMCLAMGN